MVKAAGAVLRNPYPSCTGAPPGASFGGSSGGA